jgi:hypothetical protein
MFWSYKQDHTEGFPMIYAKGVHICVDLHRIYHIRVGELTRDGFEERA